MDIKDFFALTGGVGGIVGTSLGLYNAWVAHRDKAEARRKESALKANPIRVTLYRDVDYHDISVSDRPKRVDFLLALRVVNISGKPVAIEKPFARSDDGIVVRFETGQDFPYLLVEAAAIVCKRPFEAVLEGFPGSLYFSLEPVCALADGSEHLGEQQQFYNYEHPDSPSVSSETPRPRRAAPHKPRPSKKLT